MSTYLQVEWRVSCRCAQPGLMGAARPVRLRPARRGQVLVAWRYRAMVAGTVTASSPMSQAAASAAGRVVGPPRHKARRASVMTVMGLALTKACSQPGMVATGTRVELVK